MKVKYIGNRYRVSLHKGTVYNVISVEDGWYSIRDETGEEYAFPASEFEIVEK